MIIPTTGCSIMNIDPRADHTPDRLLRRGLLGDRLRVPAHQLVETEAEDLLHHLVLRVEVVVEAARQDVCLLGDVAYGRTGHTLAGEDGRGCLEDLGAAACTVAPRAPFVLCHPSTLALAGRELGDLPSDQRSRASARTLSSSSLPRSLFAWL